MASRRRFRGWLIIAIGALTALIGVVLAAGGIWLAVLGGSLYYLLAGLGLLAAGVLLIRGSPLGVWIYLLVFVVTVMWALWEVGLDAWALVPRIFAPGILLVLILAAYALMRGGRSAWLLPAGGAAAFAAIFLVAGLSDNPHTTYAGSPRPPNPMLAAAPTIQTDPLRTGAEWPAGRGALAGRAPRRRPGDADRL